MDNETSLSVYCAVVMLLIKKLNILHPNEGPVLSTAKPIGKGSVITYYYGPLVYDDLSRWQLFGRTYGMYRTIVTSKEAKRWASKLPQSEVDKEKKDHIVKLESSPFYMMRRINDGRHLPSDYALKKERLLPERKNNVEFYQTRSSGRLSDFQLHHNLVKRALRDL